MNEEEVDLLEAELFHCLVEILQCEIARVSAVVELAGDEEFASRHACLANRLPHAFFVVVALGGVDRAVAGLDGVRDHVRGDRIVDLPDAQPELRDGVAVS